jgi:hypothetical protein
VNNECSHAERRLKRIELLRNHAVSMLDFERAMDSLPQITNAEFLGPKDESLVASAERALEFTFPPTYRLFLKRLGAGSIRGCEFYGGCTRIFHIQEFRTQFG